MFGRVLSVILATAALCACGAGAAPAPAPPSSETELAVHVTTAAVAVRDVSVSVEAIGTVEADEEVQVVAGVEGVVTRVRFQEGDTVQTSTVLAEIDPEIYRLQEDRARASLDRAAAQHAQALSDLRRREELAHQDPPLVSAEDVERARQEAERLRAAVEEARATAELAGQDRRRSIVRPLVAGVINHKTVTTGQHVAKEAVLATLADTRRLRLRFKVSEQESVRLQNGMAVTFTTAAWPGADFSARIFHVASNADPGSRMVECLARIENTASRLKPGFFAEVRATVDSRKGALVVPERAVQATDKGFVVYEARDGKARQRVVSLGLRTKDGAVEILSGLAPDARVVTDGGSALKDGMPIEIDAPAPAS